MSAAVGLSIDQLRRAASGASLTYVDCHCHLSSDRFSHDLEAVVARAQRSGVQALLVCSSSQLDILRVTELRQRFPQIVFPCLGIHPLDGSFNDENWMATRSVIVAEHLENGIAGIGEIGLDFSIPLLRKQASEKGVTEAKVRATQVEAFEAHIRLALELGVPVNVHSRNAEPETLDILSRMGAHGVMHAYKGDVSLAVVAAKHGHLLFSFPPSVVYKREYQDVAAALPPEALLLETDSPSLAAGGPQERNEPSRIGIAAAKIAELRGTSVEEISKLTTQNAARLFGPSAAGLLSALDAVKCVPQGKGRHPRWRKQSEAAKDDDDDSAAPPVPYPAKETGCSPVGIDSVPAVDMTQGSRKRWQRHRGYSRSGNSTSGVNLDPTLCTSAFGSLYCD